MTMRGLPPAMKMKFVIVLLILLLVILFLLFFRIEVERVNRFLVVKELKQISTTIIGC